MKKNPFDRTFTYEDSVDLDDPFIKKHMNRIRELTKDSLIQMHIEKMWGGLEMASIQHFIETGKINGSFHIRLTQLIEAAQRYQMSLQPLHQSAPVERRFSLQDMLDWGRDSSGNYDTKKEREYFKQKFNIDL